MTTNTESALAASSRVLRPDTSRRGVWKTWEPITRERFDELVVQGRHWLYFGQRDLVIAKCRWLRGGIKAQVDGRWEYFHPDDVHELKARAVEMEGLS